MYSQPKVAQNKPVAAAVLSIIAGILGLIFAIIAMIGVFYLVSLYEYYEVTEFAVIAFAEAIWMLIASILVLLGGTKLLSHPTEHTKWGIVILLFSIIGLGLLALSIPDWTGIAGLLDTIMGIIGGILALVFKPVLVPQQAYGYQQPYPQAGYPPPPPQTTAQQPYGQQQQIKRICPQCGRVISEDVRFCPHCGKSLA